MERWAGKVAVVTGASSGIGASIATELVDHGMTVVGLARRVEIVKELAKSLSGRKGKLHALKADVGKDDDVVAAFEWIRKNIGAVHVLVNNAGFAPHAPVSNMEREQYKKVRTCFDTNVMGVIVCTNEALKLMREKGIDDGYIINVNSVAGHYINNFSGFFVYNASKHALTVLTEGLRRELVEAKSKTRVMSISPGYVKTGFAAASESPNLEKLLVNMPFLKSIDVTNSVIHALSTPPNVQISELTIRPIGEQF